MTSQPAEKPVTTDGLASRRAAYEILNDIIYQRKSLDEAFARSAILEKLPARDRAFARLLVSVVLKRAPQMDALLQAALTEPLAALKPQQLINIFRLGIAQFAFLETPPHAAVDTSVALAELVGIHYHKPLVNAVMRRLTREGFSQSIDAGRANTPAWLWTQWEKDYGFDTALEIANANMGEAAIDFSVKNHPEQWAQTLDADILPTGSLRRKTGGFIPDLPGFTQGMWWIQGAAAALPAKFFPDLKGRTVIDLCAAPGGKTAQLAAMGATVTALDRSAERMKRLHENMERLHFTAEVVVADGAAWQPKEPVDAVLLDAPCTATGTIRHQPDVLHLKELKDQEKMCALQRKLMTNAVQMLKPGGILIYCSCSLQKAEGEDQTAWLLQQNLPIKLLPIAATELPGIAEMLTLHGELRCLPTHWKDIGGLDGFYIARFIRT